MSRSLKKGPFIEFKLEKRVSEMNKSGKKSVVKTWSRRSLISPEFVGRIFSDPDIQGSCRKIKSLDKSININTNGCT
jgi:hypothetical protein